MFENPDCFTSEELELRKQMQVFKNAENLNPEQQKKLNEILSNYHRISMTTGAMEIKLQELFNVYHKILRVPCTATTRLRIYDIAISYFEMFKHNNEIENSSTPIITIAEIEAKNKMVQLYKNEHFTWEQAEEYTSLFRTFNENRLVSTYMCFAFEYAIINRHCGPTTPPVIIKMINVIIEFLNLRKNYEKWEIADNKQKRKEVNHA